MSVPDGSWYGRTGTCLVGVRFGRGLVSVRGTGSIGGSGSHRWLSSAQLVSLIMTSTYLTKRLSEEERKKRHLVGGRTVLCIHSEGRDLLTSDTVPFQLLPAGSGFFLNHCWLSLAPTAFHQLLLSSATFYHFLPPTTIPRFTPQRHNATAKTMPRQIGMHAGCTLMQGDKCMQDALL